MDPVGERDGRRARHPRLPAAHARTRRARSHPEHGVGRGVRRRGHLRHVQGGGARDLPVAALRTRTRGDRRHRVVSRDDQQPDPRRAAQPARAASAASPTNRSAASPTTGWTRSTSAGGRSPRSVRTSSTHSRSPKATSAGCALDTKPASTTSSPPSIAARSRRSDDGSEGVAVGGRRARVELLPHRDPRRTAAVRVRGRSPRPDDVPFS